MLFKNEIWELICFNSILGFNLNLLSLTMLLDNLCCEIAETNNLNDNIQRMLRGIDNLWSTFRQEYVLGPRT